MTDKQLLTPQSISTTSFADKTEEYSNILDEVTKVETNIAEIEYDTQELFAKYSIAIRLRGETDLSEMDERLTIYLPEKNVKRDGLVFTASRSEGRAFSDIVSNPPLLKALEKKFGKEFLVFFRDVSDVFHMKENDSKKEVDEEKTTSLRVEYKILSDKLKKQKIELTKQNKKLKNVESYIDFCKKIAALAPAPQKGGGGDKNQQQKPQQQGGKQE